MKKLLFISSILLGAYLQAQVGINTAAPTATLDVNGNARIRKTDSITTAPKYVLTPDADGNIRKVNVNKIKSNDQAAINSKVIVVASRYNPQRLAVKDTDYNVTFDGPNPMSGLNSNLITLNGAKDRINLPPNRNFKITGYIGVKGSSNTGSTTNPGYITTLFQAGGDATTIVSTLGYTESSTETWDDGGVTPPIIMLSTGPNPSYVELKVRYGGGSASNYWISGSASRSGVGSYLLIEEL
ncbi:hypothetical protein [Chryseobacterium sp. ISL-6]|uniref:hypothetical protein n=1 Tax=Chryseobacterium sp. ISL-6 TaxID=2819143 RepID=UPI001BE9A3E3|nr:hypothetical protein [Chryseobacterium sp. ISL-6]MBT2621836.1 hypothetical protein [Chryseobacterium sp. ISL-6]